MEMGGTVLAPVCEKPLVPLKPRIPPRLCAFSSQARSLTGQVYAKQGPGSLQCALLWVSVHPLVSLNEALR